MLLRPIAFVLALCSAGWVQATHVLGGEMYYDHLGGDQYRITLKLYRDCGPGNTNNQGFDATAMLAIYDGNGIFQFDEAAPFPGEETVPIDLDDPCLIAPPDICAQWALFEIILDLPPNATGYVVSYQRCCRTPTMINLPTGLLQGLTCTVQIPPASSGVNSSPRFNDYPPIAMCVGRSMSFDHAAADPDGDVLVYDLYTPLNGGDALDPMPLALPPPYANIVWGPGYSEGYQMDGAPGLAIDPVSGELTVSPTLQGSFTVGVRVREFRNGQLLSASIRDLRFDVVACDVSVISTVEQQQDSCTGLTVQLGNESVNGDFWHWDFGVADTDSDTSNLEEPSWTYAAPGTYDITLIANPGWPCSDTSVSTFVVSVPVSVAFERPEIRCPNEIAQFEATGEFGATANLSWEFGGASTPSVANGANAAASFAQVGAFPVTVRVEDQGCAAAYTDSVVVHPRLELSATSDRAGCANTAFAFEAMALANTSVQLNWSFGDGTTSSTPSATHIYVATGVYDVSLTAFTEEGCVDQQTLVFPNWIEVFPQPVANFTVEPNEVSLLSPRITIQDYAQQAEQWSYVIEGITYTDPSFTHDFEEAGPYMITQLVTSGENCTDTITRVVNVTDHLFYAPNAFTPDGDGLNDTFAPSVRGARLYEIVIVDRWGVERFRSTDTKAEWSGDGLPQGIFTYNVRIAEWGAYRKEYKGFVTLLR